jgi:hypothetical protein
VKIARAYSSEKKSSSRVIPSGAFSRVIGLTDRNSRRPVLVYAVKMAKNSRYADAALISFGISTPALVAYLHRVEVQGLPLHFP